MTKRILHVVSNVPRLDDRRIRPVSGCPSSPTPGTCSPQPDTISVSSAPWGAIAACAEVAAARRFGEGLAQRSGQDGAAAIDRPAGRDRRRRVRRDLLHWRPRSDVGLPRQRRAADDHPPGNIEFDILVDETRPGQVLFYEVWESAAAQQAYMGWRVQAGDLTTLMSFLAAEPRFTALRRVEGASHSGS